MALAWNPFGVPGIVAAAIAAAMALFLYLSRPDRLQNQLLAALLLLEGMVSLTFVGLGVMADTPQVAYGLAVTLEAAWILTHPLYLAFIGTLETPMAAPFRTRLGRGLLVGYAIVGEAMLWLRRDWFVTGVERFEPSGFGGQRYWVPALGPGDTAIFLFGGLVFLYGLLAAISAYRRAPRDTVRRQRSRAVVVAFGTRDAIMVAGTFILPLLVPATLSDRERSWLILYWPIALLLFVILMAYGILKTQLFDIDLRIKGAVKHGTVLALFLGVFFAASELAEGVIQDQVGPYFGLAAAVVLAFVLNPVQRLAEGVADRLMPGVRPTPAYIGLRKEEVYREAVEGLLDDGVITPKERATLERLQNRLGLAGRKTAELERRIRKSLGLDPL